MTWDPADPYTAEPSTLAQDAVALIARLWTGCLLLLLYGLDGFTRAWSRIWYDQDWSWLILAEKLKVPSPLAILTTAVVLLVIACLGLLVGLFTRLCAIIIIALLGTLLYFIQNDRNTVELVLAYLLGPIIVLILAGGRWSFDEWVRGAERQRNWNEH